MITGPRRHVVSRWGPEQGRGRGPECFCRATCPPPDLVPGGARAVALGHYMIMGVLHNMGTITEPEWGCSSLIPSRMP